MQIEISLELLERNCTVHSVLVSDIKLLYGECWTNLGKRILRWIARLSDAFPSKLWTAPRNLTDWNLLVLCSDANQDSRRWIRNWKNSHLVWKNCHVLGKKWRGLPPRCAYTKRYHIGSLKTEIFIFKAKFILHGNREAEKDKVISILQLLAKVHVSGMRSSTKKSGDHRTQREESFTIKDSNHNRIEGRAA